MAAKSERTSTDEPSIAHKRRAANETHIVLRPKALLPRLLPEYVIEDFPATIGRHPTNDIELPFDSVSRFHARIERHDHGLRVVDLHSSNGTFVNGRRVQMAPVVDQDVLAFGGVELTIGAQKGFHGKAGESGIDLATSVHLVAGKGGQVDQVMEVDLPEQSSSIPSIDNDISDAESLRQAKERLITFYRLQEVLRSTTDEKKMLRRVLRLVFQTLPVDRGVVLIRDPQDANLFNPIAVQVREGEKGGAKSIGISKTILAKCLKDKVAVLSKDAREDDRFKESESIMLHKIRSAMCVPLVSHHYIFGFVHLDSMSTIRAFTKDDLAFMTNIGHEVATYLQNLRMLREKIVQERMAAIGQTITGLAHNIKNVLLLSQGGMELMARRLEEKSYDSLQETWGLVSRGIDRINTMVKDMLDYSRSRVAEKVKCRPNEMLEEIKQTFAEELSKRRVACALDLDPRCPPIMIDKDGLDRALENLLVNAIEACREQQGRVTLKTRFKEDGAIRIEVEDNGPGIPAEVLPRIFFPFFTTKGSQGSGLGLAMTKKFVEDMGGRIDVKTREGEGTTFTITLNCEAGDLRLETPAGADGTADSML